MLMPSFTLRFDQSVASAARRWTRRLLRGLGWGVAALAGFIVGVIAVLGVVLLATDAPVDWEQTQGDSATAGDLSLLLNNTYLTKEVQAALKRQPAYAQLRNAKVTTKDVELGNNQREGHIFVRGDLPLVGIERYFEFRPIVVDGKVQVQLVHTNVPRMNRQRLEHSVNTRLDAKTRAYPAEVLSVRADTAGVRVIARMLPGKPAPAQPPVDCDTEA